MKVLFVDNHAEFTSTVVECFLGEDDVVVVPTVAAAKERIQASRFDVVLVDYDLDDGKGDELLRWLRPIDPYIRVVAVSARDLGNEALVAAGANAVCSKTSFARIQSVLSALVGATPATSFMAQSGITMRDDLLSGLRALRGLILVVGPAGQGKTTVVEEVLAAPACPAGVLFVGDLGGDLDAAQHAVLAARSHEKLVVTDAIRALVIAGADEDAVHRRAIADGMSSLRGKAFDLARTGLLTLESAAEMTPED